MSDIAIPDVFDEARIKSDLALLADKPTAIGKYIAQAQIRFTQARQIAVLQRWTEFYHAGKEVIKARTELARAHAELQQVGREGEIKAKEKVVKLAELDAQLAEIELRKAEARHKKETLGKEKLADFSLTPEQERILNKAKHQTAIERLRQEKVRAIAAIDPEDEEGRIRTGNMYDDRIAREEEKLQRYL